MPKSKVVGSKEWAVCSPSKRGGEPDRVVVWDRSDMRTKEFATDELQNCLSLGQKAFLVSRQWEKDGGVKYEYNVRADGRISYFQWCSEDEMLRLWKCATLDEVKASFLDPRWVLVRRVKSEIEEV